MNPEDRDKLKALAEALDGETWRSGWYTYEEPGCDPLIHKRVFCDAWETTVANTTPSVADFIAAANPAAILDLLNDGHMPGQTCGYLEACKEWKARADKLRTALVEISTIMNRPGHGAEAMEAMQMAREALAVAGKTR